MVLSLPLKEGKTMQEMINSMMRFSAAITMFGMQQIQNAAELAVDSQSALKKFRENLDAVTEALIAQLDESSKPALKSMTNLGSDLVDRTMTAVNVTALDPRELMHTTEDLMRKTTDSLADMIKKKPANGEPQPAAEALSHR
jgi:hypothetical protein